MESPNSSEQHNKVNNGSNNVLTNIVNNYNLSLRKFIYLLLCIFFVLGIYLLRNFIYNNIHDSFLSFKPNHRSFKVLILPFFPNSHNKNIESNYEESIERGISQKSVDDTLLIEVIRLCGQNYIPKTSADIYRIGKDKGADLVIYGRYDENLETEIKPSYRLIKDIIFDPSKKSGDFTFQRAGQLESGDLPLKVEGICNWVSAIAAYFETDYKKTKALLEKIQIDSTKTTCEYARFYQEMSQVYIMIEEFELASKFAHTALSINKKSKCDDLQLAACYDKIVEIYYSSQALDSALISEKKSLEIVLNSNTSKTLKDSITAETYNLFGSIFFHMQEYDSALYYQKRVLEFYDKGIIYTPVLKASVLGNICRTYSSMGENHKSIEYGLQAIAIEEKIYPKVHYELASTYSNVAAPYFRLEKCDSAILFQQKALEIKEKLLPSTHLDLAGAYHNFASVLLKCEDFSNAISNQKKGILIFEKNPHTPAKSLMTAYDGLASAFQDNNQLDSALFYSKKSMALCKLHGEPIDYIIRYGNMSAIYYDMLNGQKSLEAIDSALVFFEKAIKAFSTPIPLKLTAFQSTLIANKAGILQSLHRKPNEAINLYEKSLKIANSLPEKPSPFVFASIYRDLARCYRMLNNLPKAELLSEQALSLVKDIPIKGDLMGGKLCSCYDELAYVKYLTNKKDKAKELIRAYQNFKKTLMCFEFHVS